MRLIRVAKSTMNVPCQELAAALSLAYGSYEPFNASSTSLSDYLSHNGVLVTMCLGGDCPYVDVDHVSASWIQSNMTEFRIIDNVTVGYVLDPNVLEVKCAYPVDGITNGRGQQGCGNHFPTTKRERQMEKIRIISEKRRRFGWRTRWEDIQREDMFDDSGTANEWYPWLTCSSSYCDGMIREEAALQFETWTQLCMQ